MAHSGVIQEEGWSGSRHRSSSKSWHATRCETITVHSRTSGLVILHLLFHRPLISEQPDIACWHPQCLARHTTHGCDPHRCKLLEWRSGIRPDPLYPRAGANKALGPPEPTATGLVSNSTQKTSLMGEDWPHLYVALPHHQFPMWD
jgi:hypothetical protein